MECTRLQAGSLSRVGLAATALLLSLLSGCSKPGPETSTPWPAEADQPSALVIPIEVPLKTLANRIEAQAPRRMAVLDSPQVVGRSFFGRLGIRYEVTRDPLRFSLVDNTLHVRVQGRYRLQIQQDIFGKWQPVGSCGMEEPARRFSSTLVSTISWQQGWRLATQTRASAPEFPDRCKLQLMGLEVDATDYLRYVFQKMLTQTIRDIDREASSRLDLHTQISEVWRTLGNPAQVGQGLWLLAQPQSLAAIAVHSDAETLRTGLRLTLQPQIVLGMPPRASKRPSPDLVRVGPDTGSPAIWVKASLAYPAINQYLNNPAHGVAGRTVGIWPVESRVTSLQVSPGDEGVLTRVRLSGPVTAVQVSGTPAYEADRNLLGLTNAEYAITTNSTAAQIASRLFHPVLTYYLGALTSVDTTGYTARARDALNQSLQQPLAEGARLEGEVTSLELAAVRTTPEALDLALQLRPDLRIVAGE